MKSKFAFGLLAVMMVLVLAPSSFAQVGITINNPPSPQEVQVNRAAETSDPASAQAGITVSGSLIAQSNLSTTNLILTFPNTITSRAAAYTAGGGDGIGRPPGDPIRIVAATGVFAGAAIVTQSGSTITIQLIPADIGAPGNTDSGSFRLVGVRINGNGLTAPASGSASLNSSANNFFLNTTTFPVINALGPGIGSVTSADTFQIFTNRNVTDSTGGIVITEGFTSAWRSEAQNEIDAPGATGVVASQLRLTVTGIPAGTTLTYTVTTPTNSTASTSPSTGTFTPDDTGETLNIIGVGAASGPSFGVLDSIRVDFTVSPTPLTTAPSAGAVTVTARMAPNPATDASSTALATGNLVPTYTAVEVGPATIGNIVAANTTLLLTYALRQAPFDTGIQIANTTLDPFGPTNGGATPTAGSLTFDFFPRNPAGGAGTPFQLSTTSSTVFGGLSSDGTLAPGASFVALLSEILSRTSFTGDFSGYIFVRANFLNAHGTATISDFRTYSLTANVLVMAPPASNNRNSPAGGAESLAY